METNDITSKIDLALDDYSISKRIRGVLEDVRGELGGGGDVEVRLTSAVYKLESVANDINLPMSLFS